MSQSSLVPVANADIMLEFNDGSVLHVTTDANGEYRGLVRPGLYNRVEVSGATIEDFVAGPLTINSSNNLLEFQVSRSMWMGGVITVDGAPANGVEVQGLTSVLADSRGRYALPLKGLYNFIVSYSASEIYYHRYWRVYLNLSGWNTLFPGQLSSLFMALVGPSEPSNVLYKQEALDLSGYSGQEFIQHNVSLQPSLTVSGVVTDVYGRPISNAIIYLFTPVGFSPGGYAVTDEFGRYKIDVNVAPGQIYYIQAIAKGYRFFNTSISPSGDMVFDIQLEKASKISGHVTDENGFPLDNIMLWAISDSGWSAYALTDSNGYYEFPTGFGPGDNLTIHYVDLLLWRSAGFLITKRTSFIVQPGNNILDLVYDIPSITVRGRLVDVDRESLLESVQIKVSLHANISIPYPLPSFSITVSSNGSFVFKVPTVIEFFGEKLYITSIDLGVDGWYYYPETQIASGIQTASDVDLGTIPINSYPLIEATIRVYTEPSRLTLPDFTYNLNVDYNNLIFPMIIETNSSLMDIMTIVLPNNGSISISVAGPTGTNGYIRITIPKEFLGPPYSIYLDGSPTDYNVLAENATYITIELNYRHSTHNIFISSTAVISEFPLHEYSIAVMLIAALLITYLTRRMHISS